MTYLFTLMMLLMNSLMFILSWNPLPKGLILILQTFMMALFMTFYSKTFWLSYMLLLIFIGGMLIMFLYVISLTPNSLFSPPPLALLMLIFITLMLLYDPLMIQMLKNLSLENFNLISMEKKMEKMFSSYSSMLLILLVNYLFISLISVENIINSSFAPLRKTN